MHVPRAKAWQPMPTACPGRSSKAGSPTPRVRPAGAPSSPPSSGPAYRPAASASSATSISARSRPSGRARRRRPRHAPGPGGPARRLLFLLNRSARRLPVKSPDRHYQAARTMSDVHQRIDDLVKNHRVVLFMKGTAQFPMCGFSGRAIQILKACGVNDLKTVNVLEDEEIRQGIKDYANWPTIPQLYVNGEFVGGSDIMREMYESGELQKVLETSVQKA